MDQAAGIEVLRQADPIGQDRATRSTMTTCKACELRPAILLLQQDGGSIPLCVDCNLKLSQANALDYNCRASHINALQNSLSRTTGLPSAPPRQLVPIQPIALSGDAVTNFHNITIHGSNHGIINTGSLEAVDLAVGALNRTGGSEVAQGIRALTEAVVGSRDIDESTRSKVLEMLATISEECTKPPGKRRASVALSLAADIASMIGGVAALADLTSRALPMIKGLFP